MKVYNVLYVKAVFTSDGGAAGLITVNSTENLVEGGPCWLNATGLTPVFAVIDKIVDSTHLYLREDSGFKYTRIDVSAYTTALSAHIIQPPISSLSLPRSSAVVPVILGATGYDAYADRLNGPAVTAPNNYTMCGWFKITTPKIGTYAVPLAVENPPGERHRLFIGDAGAGLDLRVGSNTGSTFVANLTLNTWHFLAMKCDATYNLSGYCGTVSGSLTKATVAGAYSGWTPSLISINGGLEFGTGIIGNACYVRVWNSILTDLQIEAERSATSPLVATNLLGFWKLESAATVLTATTGTNLTSPGGGSWTTQVGPTI